MSAGFLAIFVVVIIVVFVVLVFVIVSVVPSFRHRCRRRVCRGRRRRVVVVVLFVVVVVDVIFVVVDIQPQIQSKSTLNMLREWLCMCVCTFRFVAILAPSVIPRQPAGPRLIVVSIMS
jgi:H+/Cl- antiporter ClcA